MLGVFPNSAPDGIDKSLGLTQALTTKGFKFFLGDGDVNLIFHLLLVLLPAKQSYFLKKNGGKWHLIFTFDLSGSKMVFTLLEKLIALQISFIAIDIWELDLQKPPTRTFVLLGYRSQRRSKKSRIRNGSEDPPKVIL